MVGNNQLYHRHHLHRGIRGILVSIWKGKNGYGEKRKVGEKYPDYDNWGDPENLEPVDDWDKKRNWTNKKTNQEQFSW